MLTHKLAAEFPGPGGFAAEWVDTSSITTQLQPRSPRASHRKVKRRQKPNVMEVGTDG
jgi:hypothetical protein